MGVQGTWRKPEANLTGKYLDSRKSTFLHGSLVGRNCGFSTRGAHGQMAERFCTCLITKAMLWLLISKDFVFCPRQTEY